ncbi:alcohol dehydrogenase catalytic domain-containing protein [Paenibacillus larvae]|uniref:Oxidoreductase-like protein n=1 Tax=Paenibacillus larvae subsp. larvae DSM 25430 TaxID=697284 RepID=V9WA20_9BACL|nr:alcohol dehydrogenase catalytic domain-containing protein [Paenibacillus larvae]AHD06724.1 oxidoreductase-like protein [Paenibacillus larvae subsp. larvae DSM 25430]AVG13284.1 oxidoreductase-like protein [Paenibacillus larvae subsp. larvae DSM 25430]MDR5568729.1 alcohol dehydrogenase catalytic domain-containing protein [Paenibacillus larvae]MDR5596998.1 alcohol dehydrogenase catalytic domain-containing protein [Paenibacillus larvae]
MAKMMKAIVLPEFGGPELFLPAEVPAPGLLPGHIRIRPAATSVNSIDCRIRAGLMPQLAPKLPAILHGDVAGTVEAVGEGVTRFKPGDEVFALAGGIRDFDGALAELMLVTFYGQGRSSGQCLRNIQKRRLSHT